MIWELRFGQKKSKIAHRKSQIKKPRIAAFFCAQDKTRTCTPLRAPAPQAGVSTNFTTWAVPAQSSGAGHDLSAPCSLRYTLCSFCAQNRTRTCTSLLTLVPETSASTNFAIWAIISQKSKMHPFVLRLLSFDL